MAWYNTAGTAVNDWLHTNQAPIIMGNAASALMGSEAQNSWQGQMGRFAADMGQSKIANDALKEKQNQDAAFRQQLLQYLAGAPGTGVGLTPEGVKGDTSATWKFDPEGGYTKTVKGNSNTAPQEGINQPTKAPIQSGFTSNFAGQNVKFDPSMVPLF